MTGRVGPVGKGMEVATEVVTFGSGDDVLVTSQAGPPVDSPSATQRIATDYINTVHPDTGTAVVFVPGETIPEWAFEASK